jgi:hypothetical protein
MVNEEALSQLNDNKYYEKIQAQPDMIITSHHKPTQSPIMSRISSNLETLTTKHSNIYYHPHHHTYPSFISYQKYTSPITQGDRSYQDAIHPRTGSPHSLTHTSNHYAVHFPPTSRISIIFYKPYSTSPHQYHLTPLLLQLISSHSTPTFHMMKGSVQHLKH